MGYSLFSLFEPSVHFNKNKLPVEHRTEVMPKVDIKHDTLNMLNAPAVVELLRAISVFVLMISYGLFAVLCATALLIVSAAKKTFPLVVCITISICLQIYKCICTKRNEKSDK